MTLYKGMELFGIRIDFYLPFSSDELTMALGFSVKKDWGRYEVKIGLIFFTIGLEKVQ